MGRSNCGKVKYEGKLFPTKQSGNLEIGIRVSYGSNSSFY